MHAYMEKINYLRNKCYDCFSRKPEKQIHRHSLKIMKSENVALIYELWG